MPFPATRFIPFEASPSPAAVPHHCGPCPPAVVVLLTPGIRLRCIGDVQGRLHAASIAANGAGVATADAACPLQLAVASKRTVPEHVGEVLHWAIGFPTQAESTTRDHAHIVESALPSTPSITARWRSWSVPIDFRALLRRRVRSV
jgi:hypothetical protein